MTAEQAEAYDALVDRRAAREPLQHLTGSAAFRYVELAVGPGVFVPRPETELLAGWAVEQAQAVVDSGRVPVVVDLCTGSGAIALSVATEVPAAEVHAVELGDAAYAWAVPQPGRLRRWTSGTATWPRPSVTSTAPSTWWCATRPTSRSRPTSRWQPEARDHDPELALFSGEDGLVALRVLEQVAARLLRPSGVAGAEHADVQGESAPAVFVATGRWSDVRDHPDLAGRSRYVTARLAR